MTTESRREFEEWAKKQDVSMFTFKTRKGKYYDTITQVAWEAWQAAREQVTEQRDRLTKSIEPLKYWRDISECDCSNPLPQGGCLRCDLDRILNNQSKLIHNGVGIADMYSPDEFEIAMNRTNKA